MSRIESLILQLDEEGFSKWFSSEPLVEATPLGDAESVSAFILGNRSVQTAVAAMGHPLDIAVLGWMDQAVLMVPFFLEGVGPSGFHDAAIRLDSVELDQPGDLALLVTRDWVDLLRVHVSVDSNSISVDRLHRQTIPTATFRLIHPGESELVGHWTFDGSQCVADKTCRRIEFLVRVYLVEVSRAPERGATLFRDPTDLRLWELTYPTSEVQGGGPPTLRCVSP